VLLLQPAHSPDGVRALRAAASLLSPHSVLLLAQLDELVQTRVASGSRQLSADGEPQQVAYGSVLAMANRGRSLAAAAGQKRCEQRRTACVQLAAP
jgi:hypothetical protein